MKKLFALVLAVTLGLTACTSQTSGTEGSSRPDSQIQQEIVGLDNDAAHSDSSQKDDASTAVDTEGSSANDTEQNDPQKETTPSTSDSVNTESTENTVFTEEAKPEHKHSYTSKVIEPTCSAPGYTLHTCSCGDSYKDNETKNLSHSYCEKVVEPTTTAQGYTLHTCILCNHTYKDNFKPAIGNISSTPPVDAGTASGSNNTTAVPSAPTHQHNYAATVVPATCTTDGYTVYTCSCGESYEDDFTSCTGHKWEPVYEEVTLYATVCITRCCHCHADITGNVSTHVKEEALAGNGSRSYQSYEQVQTGTETQIVGYVCGMCGIDK